jgi:hypothetical protein
MNEYYNIVARIQTQLQGIRKDDYPARYNFNVRSDHVILGWAAPADAPGLNVDNPCIYVSVLTSDSDTRMRDQQTDDIRFLVECYGYVKHQTEAMEKALYLLNDMMVALTADEFLNEQVYDFSLGFDVASLGEFGVVVLRIRGEMNLAKPA